MVADSNIMAVILVGVNKIINLIGRCTIFEELYLRHEHVADNTQQQLQGTLLNLYTYILNFCRRLPSSMTKVYFHESVMRF